MSEGKHFHKDFTKYHSVFPVTRTVRNLLKNLEQLQSTLCDVVSLKRLFSTKLLKTDSVIHALVVVFMKVAHFLFALFNSCCLYPYIETFYRNRLSDKSLSKVEMEMPSFHYNTCSSKERIPPPPEKLSQLVKNEMPAAHR